MPDFFNYNFPVIPDNLNNNSSGGSIPSSDNSNSGVNIPKKPVSYIFTELDKVKTQTTDQAFGPKGTTTSSGGTSQTTYSEKQFNLTNTFSSQDNIVPKAFAVTDGVLFIAPQKDSPDLVNIFLKPAHPVDLGIKVKYYVYRSIKKENFFQANGSSFNFLPKDNPNILPFLGKIWEEFIEYNKIPAANVSSITFEAKKIGFDPTIPADYKTFFSTDGEFTLPKVEKGDQIGNFASEFGFEVVIDEGDFSQDHSDTGFEFKQEFFTAKKCVLNIDGNNASEVYGNLPATVSEKVFKESVYLFLDPVAYYGSHITDSSINNTNGGSIKIKNGTSDIIYKSHEEIYTNIISKFYNKNKIYIYVKSNRGRSYKFYKGENEKIYYQCLNVTQTPSSSWTPTAFLTNKWPLIIKSEIDNKYGISLGSADKNIAYIDSFFQEVAISSLDKRILRKDSLISNLINFKLNIITFNNLCISSFFNITFLNDEDLPNPNEFCNLFGNVNLKSIFEREDFSTGQGSFINHLRSTLIKNEQDIGMYRTKLILEGDYIADTNSPALPSNTTDADLALSKNLRTYILLPQQSTLQKKDDHPISLTSGYYSAKDMDEYISNIYKGGEIWRGTIKDGSDTIDSLLYRRKDNDEGLPIYQLGISQKDYLILENNAKTLDINATNFFFNIEELSGSTSSAFIKYKMKLQFDKENGMIGITTQDIPLYTVDGYLFFTKDYSSAFKYGKKPANIAVDFVPHNLSSYLSGYECGFDYFWKDYDTSPADGGRFYENLLGKYYEISTGKLANLDVDHPTDYTFKIDRRTFLNLIALKYNSKPTNWRFAAGESAFHTDSYLTLYPKPHPLSKEVTVNLKFSKSKNPDQLYIKYNKKFIAINNNAAIATANDEYGKFIIPKDKYINPITNTNNNYSIKITALEKCNEDIPIEVIAVEGKNEKLAGKCWIRKNSEKYTIDIVLVNCKTNLNGILKEGLPLSNEIKVKEILQNFLRQILINPILEVTSLDLTLNSNNFKTVYAPNGKIESSEGMFNYVKGLLTNSQKNKMVLLFFDESATEPNLKGQATIINDYIGGAIGARIFAFGITDNAIAHEALHSLGLYHSFDNNGNYTFKKGNTNNIMDYNNTRALIWYWQDLKVKHTSNNNKLIADIE